MSLVVLGGGVTAGAGLVGGVQSPIGSAIKMSLNDEHLVTSLPLNEEIIGKLFGLSDAEIVIQSKPLLPDSPDMIMRAFGNEPIAVPNARAIPVPGFAAPLGFGLGVLILGHGGRKRGL